MDTIQNEASNGEYKSPDHVEAIKQVKLSVSATLLRTEFEYSPSSYANLTVQMLIT